MNGAEKIVNAIKKVNQSNQTIPSEIVSVTLTGKNPFTFKVENRIEITPGFYELSNLVDWTQVEIGDVFKAFTFNEGQKYFILEGFTVASGGGGGTQPAPSSVIEQLKQSVVAVIPIGGGCDYFGATEPENFKFANGQALSIVDYPELYAVIGETYRKDDNTDVTTFNLPDKRRSVTGMYDSTDASFDTLGETVGNNTHTLIENELPKLSGSITMHSAETATNIAVVSGKFTEGMVNTNTYKSGGTQSSGSRSIGIINWSIGNNKAHISMQSTLVCNYIIRVK